MTLIYIGITIFIIMLITRMIMNKNIEIPPMNLPDDDILRLAQEGKTIQAIKWYRTLHNTGLKEAKEAVEKMIKES